MTVVSIVLVIAASAGLLLWWLNSICEEARIIARIGPALIEAPVFFELIDISHHKSHFLERHGPMLQRCEVLQRAKTGRLEVAGHFGRPVASAKWYSHKDMLHAIISAAEHWRNGDRPKNGKYVFEFDEYVGEGFLKGSDELVQTKIVAVVTRNDYVVTAFPGLKVEHESHSLVDVS